MLFEGEIRCLLAVYQLNERLSGKHLFFVISKINNLPPLVLHALQLAEKESFDDFTRAIQILKSYETFMTFV